MRYFNRVVVSEALALVLILILGFGASVPDSLMGVVIGVLIINGIAWSEVN